MNQFMIDLETLDSRETAAIISIGIVAFDLETFQIDDGMLLQVSAASSQSFGLTISADTVEWWMKQSKEAQESSFKGQMTLPAALTELEYYTRMMTVKDKKYPVFWGNGSTFDNMILRNAYRACNMKYPANYKGDLCYRTIKTCFPEFIKLEGTCAHNALSDAKAQAESLVQFFKTYKMAMERIRS